MLPLIRRQAQRQAVRSYASAAGSSGNAYTQWLVKGQSAVQNVVYYTKVAGELARYVWLKEGLSPPTVQQVQHTFTTDAKAFLDKALKSARKPAEVVETVRGWSKNNYIVGGAAVIQILGIFALGEIIGRRHIYGYKTYEHHEHAML